MRELCLFIRFVIQRTLQELPVSASSARETKVTRRPSSLEVGADVEMLRSVCPEGWAQRRENTEAKPWLLGKPFSGGWEWE